MLGRDAAEPTKQAQALASLDREEKQALAGRAREGFESAIAPLEARARRRLRGPWRARWEAAFNESPEGFCRVRDDVLARPWVQSPFAYFNRLLEDGDHRELAPMPPAEPDRCRSCGYAAPLHLAECEHAQRPAP